jgi:hypothetical protein
MTRREFIAAATIGAAGQPLTTTARVAPPIRAIAFDGFVRSLSRGRRVPKYSTDSGETT